MNNFRRSTQCTFGFDCRFGHEAGKDHGRGPARNPARDAPCEYGSQVSARAGKLVIDGVRVYRAEGT